MGLRDSYVARFDATTYTPKYSILLGGNGYDLIWTSVADENDNLIIAGFTESTDFPITASAYDTSYNGGLQDGFMAKLDRDGRRLLFSSYIGGRGWDEIFDMKRGPDGSIYAVGATDSYTSFPRTPDALQRSYGGGDDDMFIVALDSSGRTLKYASFFGGNGFDEANSLCIAPNGEVAIGGMTSSTNLQTSAGALQRGLRGQEDGFLLVLDSTLRQIRYASYLGGSKNESIVRVLYNDGELFGCGHTSSRDLPVTSGVVQERKSEPNGPNESIDSFVFRLNIAPGQLRFLTYIGGEGDDEIEDMVLWNKLVFLGGSTTSSVYPCTADAAKKVKHGYFDGIVTVLNDSGAKALYSSYYGGTNSDGINAFLFDTTDHILLSTGFTTSVDYPCTPDAAQKTNAGENDAFLLALDMQDLISGVRDQEHSKDLRIVYFHAISPHPFGQAGFLVSFETRADMASRLTLFDALGRRVAERMLDASTSRRHVQFEGHDLAPGAYMLVLEAGGERATRTIVKGW